MLRSVAFVIEGRTATRVVVAANLDGTLTFELTRSDCGPMSALEAVLFDLSRSLPDGGFRVFGDAGVSLDACAATGMDTLGRTVTVRERVVDPLGDFDIGLYFGAMPEGRRDAGRVGFTLAHDSATLSLDMIDRSDFGLRHAPPTCGRVERGTSACAPALPSGTPHTGAERHRAQVRPDALALIEMHEGAAVPLASDPGGILAVIDVSGADARAFSLPDGGPQPDECRPNAPRDRRLAVSEGEDRRGLTTGHWSGLSPLG